MKRMKAFLLAIALLMTLSGMALAHDRDRDDHDRDHDRGKHRGWSQQRRDHHDNGRHLGWYKQRDRDRDRDRDGDRDDDYRGGRRSYPNGSYNPYYGNGRYRNGGGYYGNGGYRNGGAYGNDAASQFGYRDGLQAGQRDRATGHSYRPTEWEAYRDADHGLSSSGGYYRSSGQYQQAYRQAFVEGYRQGYGANGYGYGGYRR